MTNYTKLAVKGAATVFVISLLAAFMGYLVRLVLARNLSMEDFGLFYAVFAFLGIFGAFKNLGYEKALARFIPEYLNKGDKNSVKSVIIYSAVIQLFANFLLILVIFLFSSYLSVKFFHTPKADIVLKLMAVAIFLDSGTQVLKHAFQGFRNMAHFAGIDLVRMTIILAAVLVGLKLNHGLLSPVIAYIISPLLLIIIFGWVLVKYSFPNFFKSKFVHDKSVLKNMSKYSIFIMATTVGTVIFGYTDTVVLTYFTGLTSVALYNVALPTSKLFLYFSRAIGSILLPLTSEFWANKKEKLLKAGMEALYKYSVIIIIPAVFAAIAFAEFIIVEFFGGKYLPASNALRILSIGMLSTALTGITQNFFSGIGKPEINSKIIYSAALFNLISNLILIPPMGILGAAITTALSYFIMMFMSLVEIRKYIQIEFPVAVWTKSFVSGLIFIFAVWFLKKIIKLSNVWMEAAITLSIAGIIYTALMFLLKIINIKEFKDLYKRIFFKS